MALTLDLVRELGLGWPQANRQPYCCFMLTGSDAILAPKPAQIRTTHQNLSHSFVKGEHVELKKFVDDFVDDFVDASRIAKLNAFVDEFVTCGGAFTVVIKLNSDFFKLPTNDTVVTRERTFRKTEQCPLEPSGDFLPPRRQTTGSGSLQNTAQSSLTTSHTYHWRLGQIVHTMITGVGILNQIIQKHFQKDRRRKLPGS